MLLKISSSVFRKKEIIFNNGLNVIKGDEHATNSIGKSSMLLIVDFVFGGDTYVDKNKDSIKHLGHHSFEFVFLFNGKKYYFSRSTVEPNYIKEYSINFVNEIDSHKINDYKNMIKEKYDLTKLKSSFRDIVSLYSRIWGKENDNVKRPLHSFSQDKNRNTVVRLLQLFNKYNLIDEQELLLKNISDKYATFNKSVKHEILPKITKKQYVQNKKQIEQLQKEINFWNVNQTKVYMNLDEYLNETLRKLREQKSISMTKKLNVVSKLKRLNQIHNSKNGFSDYQSLQLQSFFPSINLKKISEVELFHNKVYFNLINEVEKNKVLMTELLESLDSEISKLDNDIENELQKFIAEKNISKIMYDSVAKMEEKIRENSYYEEVIKTKGLKKTVSEKLELDKIDICNDVSKVINSKMYQITEQIYHGKRKSPSLELTPKDYKFETFNNTGTGVAYGSLVVFDLSIFEKTVLPILIHDSFLFKNIEIPALNDLIKYYSKFEKQIFISIDESQKFSQDVQLFLNNNTRLSLSDSEVLFIKDWRNI